MLDIVSGITALYVEVDQRVKSFQLKTGLRCPAGCGRCCPAADVRATVLEMLPAAHEILRRGTPAFWLARIESEGAGGTCVFYRREAPPDAQGCCDLYALRPTVCRLFGFAAVRTRSGALELAVCRWMKAAGPDAAAAGRHLQGEAPCFSSVATQINALDLSLGARPMPVNEALRRALERLGLAMQLTQSQAPGGVSGA